MRINRRHLIIIVFMLFVVVFVQLMYTQMWGLSGSSRRYGSTAPATLVTLVAQSDLPYLWELKKKWNKQAIIAEKSGLTPQKIAVYGVNLRREQTSEISTWKYVDFHDALQLNLVTDWTLDDVLGLNHVSKDEIQGHHGHMASKWYHFWHLTILKDAVDEYGKVLYVDPKLEARVDPAFHEFLDSKGHVFFDYGINIGEGEGGEIDKVEGSNHRRCLHKVAAISKGSRAYKRIILPLAECVLDRACFDALWKKNAGHEADYKDDDDANQNQGFRIPGTGKGTKFKCVDLQLLLDGKDGSGSGNSGGSGYGYGYSMTTNVGKSESEGSLLVLRNVQPSRDGVEIKDRNRNSKSKGKGKGKDDTRAPVNTQTKTDTAGTGTIDDGVSTITPSPSPGPTVKVSPSPDIDIIEDTNILALLVPTTSKNMQLGSILEFPLFTILLRSFKETIPQSNESTEFRLYLGYDEGDGVFDGDEQQAAWKSAVEDYVKGWPLEYRSLKLIGFGGAPAKCWNALALLAYEEGADYFYQLNDDIEFSSGEWDGYLMNRLKSNSFIPNFGATGPVDTGNPRLLTQSIVHRTHIDILGYYYPPVLKNWYSDDWITLVYQDYSTTVCEAKVRNINPAGTRYAPSMEQAPLITDTVKEACVRIQEWLNENGKGGWDCSDAKQSYNTVGRNPCPNDHPI